MGRDVFSPEGRSKGNKSGDAEKNQEETGARFMGT
jgi:hypothetical protein